MNHVQHLQVLQQTLQKYTSQKQQVEARLLEVESALKELQHAEKAYKIVGPVLVAAPPLQLQQELGKKKEQLLLRLQSFAQQEERVQKNLEKVQKEVIGGLKH